MHLTMIVLNILAHNSLIAVKAQLDEVVASHEFLFVAVVDMSSSLDDRFSMRKESR